MAGWMDMLMSGAGYPSPLNQPPQAYDPELDPLVDYLASGKKKNPFPEPKRPIEDWGPFAGILEPGIGQINQAGLEPGRAYMKDPMMPGNSPSPFMAAPERAMQSLVDPNIEQTAERVPTPRARPEIREADGAVMPSTDISSSTRGGAAPGQAPDAGPSISPPTGGQLGQPAQEPPSFFGSLIPRVGNFLKNNSNTLLALGAGMAGAPNVGQGISRASAAAIPASQADIKNRTTLQSQSATYRALIEAGVPPNQALAAVGNPEMAKALIPAYISDRKREIKEVKEKDFLGGERTRLYSINPYDPTDVKEVTPGAGRGGAARLGQAAGEGTGYFAPGVTADTIDHSKVGEDYLRQFSPEVQAGVRAVVAGKSLPTGRQGLQQAIKMVAQKYGADIGVDVSDQAYFQRKTFGNSVADTKSGVGLQAKGAQQGLEHFVKLSDTMAKLKLSNGLGLEPVANFNNWFKSLSTDQQDLIHNANVKGQALAGEMGKLFSGSSGGGVHERAETKKNISNAFQSSKAAAGSLEGVLEMMEGGINSLTQRRDQLFPDKANWPAGSDFMTDKQLREIEHIKQNIAILRGEAPAGGTAPARGNAPSTKGSVTIDGKAIPWSVN